MKHKNLLIACIATSGFILSSAFANQCTDCSASQCSNCKATTIKFSNHTVESHTIYFYVSPNGQCSPLSKEINATPRGSSPKPQTITVSCPILSGNSAKVIFSTIAQSKTTGETGLVSVGSTSTCQIGESHGAPVFNCSD